MSKRLRSPENVFHPRQEKKFITDKDLELLSEERMKQVFAKTKRILFDGAKQSLLSEPAKNNTCSVQSNSSAFCCSRFKAGSQVIDANGNSEMSVSSCSYCDRNVCNNCGLNCMKCYKIYCPHCCVPDFNHAHTAHICYTCYS